jgi:hypothetical protein
MIYPVLTDAVWGVLMEVHVNDTLVRFDPSPEYELAVMSESALILPDTANEPVTSNPLRNEIVPSMYDAVTEVCAYDAEVDVVA